jgi:serine/threonine protein kinase
MTEAAKPPRPPPPPRPSSAQVPAAAEAEVLPDTISAVTSARALQPSSPEPAADSAGAPPTSRVDAFIGKVFDGRYVIERLLGEGGMGMVFAARHKMIDKRVAIKVLRGEMASDPELTERFLQEARSASAIGNPHIIDISDFGHLPDGSTYFVMEFLDGKSLGSVLTETQGPLPLPRLLHIAKQMANALAAAHAASIVHRDMKPDNVMLIGRGAERDFVKILDFGIAKVGGGTKKMTRAGSVFGTPHYMSPEQAAGAAVDHRTDIYALGVILYEMASGKVPFDADNFMGILTQHMYKAPVPIRALVPEVDVSPGLDAIVLKCLSKKPEARYATMDELGEDLDKIERGLLPTAVDEMMARSGGFNVPADYFRSAAMPAPVPGSPPERKKRWPLYASIGAVGTLVGVMAVVTLARSPSSGAQTQSTGIVVPATAVAAPSQAPSLAPVETIAPTPAAVPATHEVIVSATPGDATITRDGTDLGPLPVVLQLADGQAASLVITHKGYKPKTVKVTSADSRVAFQLDSMYGGAAPARPAAAAARGGGMAVDDVGDPFAKH